MENNIDAEQQFAAGCADGDAMRFAVGALCLYQPKRHRFAVEGICVRFGLRRGGCE